MELREKLGKLKIHHFGGNNNPRALTRPTPYLKYRDVMDIIESVNTTKHETVEELRERFENLEEIKPYLDSNEIMQGYIQFAWRMFGLGSDGKPEIGE